MQLADLYSFKHTTLKKVWSSNDNEGAWEHTQLERVDPVLAQRNRGSPDKSAYQKNKNIYSNN